MSWTVTREKTLSMDEIRQVVADLRRRGRRSINSQMNLTLFRLATCAGLRASELCGLTLNDVRVSSGRPSIYVPKHVAKGGKHRTVPLTWDQSTLDDVRAWKAQRMAQGATGADLFLCSRTGTQLDRRNARMRFKACCRVLGPERVDQLTIHFGRHSFVSHALHGGRSINEVRAAAGHSNIGTTSLYTHIVGDDDGVVGNLFD